MATTPTPHTPTSSHNEPQSRNNGWWETYVIRYLVGTVVGGAILLFLNASDVSGLKENLLPGITSLKSLDAGILTVIGAVGFAYCYLASAPILVLHASRAVLLNSNRKAVTYWLIGLGIVTVIAMLSTLFWSGFEASLITHSPF